jgi:hypothetical protein
MQTEVRSIAKTAENGHFKNTYAPLDAVMDYALPLLAKHKLGLSQFPITLGGKHYLHSVLFHESGVNVQSDIELLVTKQDPQGLGSALTYEKRQTVMAFLGLSAKDEDDDANKAAGHLPSPTQEQLDEIAAICKSLKFPQEEVDRKLRNLRTADQAVIALNDLDTIIAGRAAAIKARKAAESAEVHIDVIEDDAPEASPVVLAKRLKALGLKDDVTVRELIRANTGKPFLKNCKPSDLEKLARALTRIEAGDEKLPGDWYAPTTEALVVEEPTA